MSAPFRAQAFGRVVLLQTAAEWAETTDKVLQDYETGRETDTGYEKTGDGVSTWAELAYDDPTPTPGGVKVYRALLTQTGTDDPTATVLENTLGGTVVWTRNNPGRYDATLAGAFTEDKTATNSGACMNDGNTMLGWFAMERTDSDVMRLITTGVADASITVDDVLASTYVKITVDR